MIRSGSGADAATVTARTAASRPVAWLESAMEAVEIAVFMISACAFAVLLEHPRSPVLEFVPAAVARRAIMGVAMGLTAIAIIGSPFGRRSGAHMNPSVTLTFLWLGRIAPRDAAAYIVAQCAGAIAGVAAAKLLLGDLVAHDAVNHVATLPGVLGVPAAFAAEAAISFALMAVVLLVPQESLAGRMTGLCAGLLVSLFITIEAPVSGMSMNPARSLGSAFWSSAWMDLWIYMTAPPLGMLLAAAAVGRIRNGCAKLHHDTRHGCIFCSWIQRNR